LQTNWRSAPVCQHGRYQQTFGPEVCGVGLEDVVEIVRALAISMAKRRLARASEAEPASKRASEALKKCCLGPKRYAYVTSTHEGLGLTLKGLVEPRRVVKYLDSLLTALLHLNVGKEGLSKLVDKLKLILKTLEERLGGQWRALKGRGLKGQLAVNQATSATSALGGRWS